MNIVDSLKKLIPEKQLVIKDRFVEAQLTSEKLETILLYCYEHLGFYWLRNICVTDEETQFRFRYILNNPQASFIFSINTTYKIDEVVKSIVPIWQNAKNLESEIYEMFGVKFDYSPKRKLFSSETQEFPLRKNFSNRSLKPSLLEPSEGSMLVEIDLPLNTNDVIFEVKLDNDSIEECQLDFGYHHIGIEKNLEGINYNQVLQQIKYLNYDTGIFWSMAWTILIEEGNNISIPDKAKGLRMILSEMVRIKDHLKTLGHIAYKTEYVSFFNTIVYWYNRSLDQIRSLTPRNSISDMLIVGGVRDDLPVGWMASCTHFLSLLEKKLLEEYHFFYNSSFWKERLSCGGIPREHALKSGIGGPALRASGINHDLRKKKPYYFYSEVSFDVPLGIDGLIYDRFLVLVEEIFQSIKIINQVLDNIPAGKIISDDIENIYSLSTNGEIDNANIYKKLVTQIPTVNFKENFISLESSNGLIDIWASFDEQGQTQRVSCSENSSKLLNIFQNQIEGEKIEDLVLFWLSLGINMVEAER